MNVETVKSKEINQLTPEQLLSGKWKRLGKRPDSGCKRCHGRGYLGLDIVTKTMIECRCVKVRPEK